MNTKLLYLLIVLTGFMTTSLCQAGMNEEKFRQFYYNYYKIPASSEEVISAFEYFVKISSLDQTNRLWQTDSEKAAYARFFALLAEKNPLILRHAERLFLHAFWPQKEILLEIFRRANDNQLRTNLKRWALSEEDDDRRIQIEQAALVPKSPEALFIQPLRSTSDLEEQWAYFFALGNTRVVEASIDLLSNTVSGFCRPGEKGQSSYCELYPRERRLRERTANHLLNRALLHPTIRDALLRHPWITRSVEGQSLLKVLAYQALDLQDAELARHISDRLTCFPPQSPRRLHYTGALAVLEKRDGEVLRIIRILEKKDRILCEWLRGYRAYIHQSEVEKSWKKTAVPAGGRRLTLLCSQTLAQAKSLGVYEVWHLQEIPAKEHPYVHFCQQITALQMPDRRFSLRIRFQPEAAWFLKGENTFRWSGQKSGWVKVENKVIHEQIKNQTGVEETRNLLASQYPASIFKILGPDEQKIAGLVYKEVHSTRIVDDALSEFFPGQNHKIKEISFWVDSKQGKILHMQIKIDVYKNRKKIATGEIERIFYNYDSLNLSWGESLRVRP